MKTKTIRPRLSGEVQYFRIPRERWEPVLDRLAEAHCNTVSTYIPWGWHEPREGCVDMTGETHPCRDLMSFLELVQKRGFDFIARPGPYINAETSGQGHPLWLLDNYPDLLVHGPDGKPLPHSACYFGAPVSYLHPDYLKRVKGWYRQVCAILKDVRGLKTFQVDNEISYNIMHVSKEKGATYLLDYAPYIVGKGGLYQRYLQDKYGTVDALNRAHRSRHVRFETIRPPTGPGSGSDGVFVATVDWLDFKEWMMAEFLRRLMEMAYGFGMRVPFVVNSPLIDDSCVYRFHQHVRDPRWKVIAALDLYPGCVRPEELGWMQSMVEFARSTGCDRPAGAEICACEIYFRHHWIQEKFDYEALFTLLTASGLVDLNYYWFADGENFDGFGCLGPRQVYSAPITRAGRKRYQYGLLAKNNRFILAHPDIQGMKTRYDVALTYDDLYSQASRFANPHATDWHSEFIHGEENMGGLIDLLGAENIAAQMLHITDDFAKCEAPILVITAYEFWRRGLHEKVRRYVEDGGDAVIFGRLPTLDEQLFPYPELVEWCGIEPDIVYPEHPRALRTVSVVRFEGEEYQFHSKVQTYRLGAGAKPRAWVDGDRVCGAEVRLGQGRLRVFGAIPRLFMEASRTFIRRFLGGPNPEGLYRYVREDAAHRFTTLLNVSDVDKTALVSRRRVKVSRRSARFVYA